MLWKQSGNKYYNLYNNKLLTLTESYIPKSNGKVRKIFIANKLTKKFYRSLLPKLYDTYKILDKNSEVAHGFLKNKSSITNALTHAVFSDQWYNTTISLDIKDFFSSITPKHVPLLDSEIHELCFINNQLPQGLPTSPIIANIAMASIDLIILDNINVLALEYKFRYIYTRYADDITLSLKYFNGETISKINKKISRAIVDVIEGVLLCKNIKLNHKKTKYNRLSDAVNITGVNLYSGKLVASRKTKRNLRAACHQKNFEQIIGLLNWIETIRDANKEPLEIQGGNYDFQPKAVIHEL